MFLPNGPQAMFGWQPAKSGHVPICTHNCDINVSGDFQDVSQN